uniref:SFRICE_007473 n=1 Tax=Spodoptera frugiperda TaxID=7108 RepID=A0A2H1WYI1_SPOFR
MFLILSCELTPYYKGLITQMLHVGGRSTIQRSNRMDHLDSAATLQPICLRLGGSRGSSGSRSLFTNAILLEGSHKGSLVSRRLEATMTELGRCVDELKVDLLKSGSLRVDTHLPQSDDTLLGSHTATLDHDEVIVDFSIVGETTHGGDGLLRQVVFSRSIVLDNLAILVLVEPTTAVLGHVLGPNSEQSAETMRSFDVTNHTNAHHWWRLDDGHSLYDLLLVDL